LEINLPRLQLTDDNGELLSAIGTNCQLAGGTAWVWARPDAFQSVDVLFIDEAAQMSLANVLAVSQAAKSIVLLGDPRQLEQPMQGSHPEGTDVSALDHILGVHQTIPADSGLFLEETWRLHPEICAFTSELFYEARLRSRPGLELQKILSKCKVNGSGLRFLPVVHEGNQSSCPEEADTIRELIAEILGSKATWVDSTGKETAITHDDILIIAPYNAQVFELQQLPEQELAPWTSFRARKHPLLSIR
jgi:superfamily I DNA and/or RNA helicase